MDLGRAGGRWCGVAVAGAVAVTLWGVTACGARDTATFAEATVVPAIAVHEGAPAPEGVEREHRHTAYGVWLCDHYVEDLVDRHGDRIGVHTHADGVIHVHRELPAGDPPEATLAQFGAEVDLHLQDGRLVLPDGTTLLDGDACPSGPAVVSVHRWAPTPAGDATAEILTTELGDVPLRDGDALAVVFAPDGTAVPPPRSVDTLDLFAEVAAHPTSTSTPTPTPATTAVRPTGDRASFALWLVGRHDATDGGCTSPAVGSWAAGSGSCFTPVPGGERLGPDMVTGARAVQPAGAGAWYVELTLSADGLEQFNRLVAAAWRDRRGIAIELGGLVLSAPLVQTDRFTEPELLIPGGLDETAARAIARVLDRP